jgi:hypothetical protein
MDTGITLYEMNKSTLKNMETLEGRNIMKTIKKTFIPFLKEKRLTNNYFMLLCNELKDYTLFDFDCNPDNTNEEKNELACKDLKECFLNRGNIYDMGITEDKEAIEIWVKYYADEEPHLYYFFPYDIGVITL